MKKITILLKNVLTLVDKYDAENKKSGESFNIFSIMKMEYNEVKTHSSIIGEFLNPKGSHGLKDVPLKLFIKEIKKNLDNTSVYIDKLELDTNSSKVIIEEYIGEINEDKTAGGRIDIVVKDMEGKVIAIENKIHAKEQENQLLRYKNEYQDGCTIYLTLYGKESDYESEKFPKIIKGEDYLTCSYHINILNWLNDLLEQEMPERIRQVVNQYLGLVKKITNQTINVKMKKQIKVEIKQNFLAASEIFKNFKESRYDIISELFEEVAKKINEIAFVLKAEFKNEKDKYNNRYITIKTSKSDKLFYCRYTGIESNKEVVTVGIMGDFNIKNFESSIDYKDLETKLDDEFINNYLKGKEKIVQEIAEETKQYIERNL